MKKIFFLSLFFSLSTQKTLRAQQECGTKAYSGKDTAIINRLAEQELKTQDWINNSPESRTKYYKVQYPSIPGFTPTGDYYKDATLYAEAKRNFIINDPDGYKRWLEELGNPNKQKK